MLRHGRSFDINSFVKTARLIGSDTPDVEVKSAAGGLPKDIVETLSAFSNTSGGILICGLSEREGFAPAAGFDAKAAMDALGQACSEKLEPPVRPHMEIVQVEGAAVLVAEIPEMPPASKPCYVKARSLYDGSFIRTGDGDRRLSRYEVDRLLELRTQPRFDEEVVGEADVECLDEELVQGFLARERANAPRVFGKLSDEDALISTRVLKRGADGALHPTLAGLMALAMHPQEFFPRLNVTFAAFPGTSKGHTSPEGVRFLDSKTVYGPVPVLVAETLAAVRRNVRTVSRMEGASRIDMPDYPDSAVREAVTNALMHRDYSPEGCGSQVQVNLFTDRLEVLNVGGLFGGVTVDRLGEYGLSAARNQRLSRILESTPFPTGYAERGYVVENKGTGFAQIERALADAGMEPPVARDNVSSFSLTMYRRDWTPQITGGRGVISSADALGRGGRQQRKGGSGSVNSSGSFETVLDDGERWIVNWVSVNGPVRTAQVAEGLGVSHATALRRLNGLCTRGVLERTGRPRSPELTYRLAM